MPNAKLPPRAESAIVVGATADDWRDAVQIAGKALARASFARPGYAGDMIRMIEENGPYVVVAPGFALAQARPGPRSLTAGMSVVTLGDPVLFGHPHHDPVRVVVGLASTTAEEHLAGVAAVANAVNDGSLVERLGAARSAVEILEAFDAVG